MLILKRIAVLVVPAVITVSLIIGMQYPATVPWSIGIGAIIAVIATKYLSQAKLFSHDLLNFSIAPVILVGSLSGFAMLQESGVFRFALIVLAGFLLLVYWENMFLFFHIPQKYQPYSLENISGYLSLLSFFSSVVVLYGLIALIDFPMWLAASIFLVVTTLLLRQSFWINKIHTQIWYAYVLVLDMVLVQAFWVMGFLPLNYYVAGIIITLLVYLTWGLSKAKLTGTLNRKTAARYLISTVALLALVVLTSRWT